MTVRMASEPSHRLKFYRAQHHFEQLHAKLTAWTDGHPYATRVEPHDEKPDEFVLKATAEPIPEEELTPLIGDVIQNLRSSLDHLVFALSEKNFGPLCQKQAKFVQFPLLWNDHGQPRTAAESFKKRPPSSLQFVSEAARAEIERLQPYNVERDSGGTHDHTDSFLWKLHELSNLDKHQTIPLVGFVPNNIEIRSAFDGHVILIANAMVKVDTPIARVRIPPDSRYRDVKVDLAATMEIGFANYPAAGDRVLGLLDDILRFVAHGVIAPLEQFL